jgi:hypothetical protein
MQMGTVYHTGGTTADAGSNGFVPPLCESILLGGGGKSAVFSIRCSARPQAALQRLQEGTDLFVRCASQSCLAGMANPLFSQSVVVFAPDLK